MKSFKLFKDNTKKWKLIEKFDIFFEKNQKRLIFMRRAYERVNGACEFEKIGVKRGKSLKIVLKSLA